MKIYDIIIEPKFAFIEVTTLPKYIYHVSPSIFKLKILKQGLTPNSKNDLLDYPTRIYFFTNENQLKEYVKLFYNTLPIKSQQRINSYDVYKINSKDVDMIRFLKYPNLDVGNINIIKYTTIIITID